MMGEGSYGQVYKCTFIKENHDREVARKKELDRKFRMHEERLSQVKEDLNKDKKSKRKVEYSDEVKEKKRRMMIQEYQFSAPNIKSTADQQVIQDALMSRTQNVCEKIICVHVDL